MVGEGGEIPNFFHFPLKLFAIVLGKIGARGSGGLGRGGDREESRLKKIILVFDWNGLLWRRGWDSRWGSRGWGSITLNIHIFFIFLTTFLFFIFLSYFKFWRNYFFILYLFCLHYFTVYSIIKNFTLQLWGVDLKFSKYRLHAFSLFHDLLLVNVQLYGLARGYSKWLAL